MAAVVVVVGVVALTGSDPQSVDVTETPLEVPVRAEASEATGDTVTLDASVFTPTDGTGEDSEGRHAAVVLAHGFGGSKADLAEQARDVAAEGYVVVTYTARGFGGSGGLIHLNSPDYEVADASRLLDLLAERDDVRLDGEGDPVVGMAGGSYGGAISLLTAAYDDRVDAIVPAITWNDLAQSLYPQSAVTPVRGGPTSPATVDPVADPGVLKRRWASLFFAGALEGIADGPGGAARSDAPGPAACGRFDPEICRLYAESATTGRPTSEVLALLRRSSPAPVLDRVTAPTLLVQGEQDSLFGLDQADATARALAEAGTPVGMRWIDGGHDASGDTSFAADLIDPAKAWFDHYLRGGPDPGTDFEFTLPNAALEDGPVERRQAAAYPTDGAGLETQAIDLAGGAQPVVSPPGGEPTALTGLPGTGPLLGAAAGLSGAGFRLAAIPGASAVFESPPSDGGLVVVGAPRVRLSVTSTTTDATLFASLWIVSTDGTPLLPRQLVSPVQLSGLTPGEPREVDVALPASAYEVAEGQRLRLLVSSTDAAYAVPRDGRAYQVALAGGGDGALRLPLVASERAASSGPLVPLPLLVTVGLLLLAAALVALLGVRRRRPAPVVEDLREVPLVVDGLVKAYSNGFRAVDGVSWRAERGQVVGLLGPNGAGKTTTMRMLVGLIRADGGRIHVLGHEVTAGAPVLSRVGALIEGPGFLPHLTGRENLHAFWAATGKPEEAAGYEEALAIADLGVALDKPVRSYSHGMQQRLGIAQSMLGLPELLLLDEPTNGLDPPQIRAMRGVLARYAAGGRTVVVSSHLLSEVEQTCSHVVVMHRGRVVLEGAVADLVEGSETTVVTVDGDPAAATAVLTGIDGVTDVSVDDEGRVRVEGTAPRPRLVAALVEHGVPVSSVDGRRHLEEVFMSLVGDDRPAQVQETYVGGRA